MNVIVTGAASGIGKALASVFARNGHSLFIVDKQKSRLLTFRDEIRSKYSTPVVCQIVDLSEQGAASAVFQEATRIFGKVHVLINNAGMSPYQDFCDLCFSHLDQIVSVNIRSLAELCSLFMSHMLAHGEPCHVVNISSVGGFTPLPKFSVYTGSKHFVRAFSDLLNYEYRKTNIKVSVIYHGGTLTDFPYLSGQHIRGNAVRTLMTPEKVAEISYPAILKGKRVIIPGVMNYMAILFGKIFPFPLTIRVMEFIYNHVIDPTQPNYPLQ